MRFLNGLANGGKLAAKVFAVGTMSLAQHGLRNKNNELMNDVNGQIGRGYDYYARPQIDKGLKLVRLKKDRE